MAETTLSSLLSNRFYDCISITHSPFKLTVASVLASPYFIIKNAGTHEYKDLFHTKRIGIRTIASIIALPFSALTTALKIAGTAATLPLFLGAGIFTLSGNEKATQLYTTLKLFYTLTGHQSLRLALSPVTIPFSVIAVPISAIKTLQNNL